jgi:hypothetical protein
MFKAIIKLTKMKKYLLLLFIMLGCFSLLKAQNGNGQKGEKIQALKIAFITQKLQLTSAEAQKFWPVYNQYENEVKNIRTNNKNGDVLENEEQLLNVRKKYKPQFEKIIGPQKMNNLFNAERDFRNVLIKRLKNRNQQRNR